MSWRIQIIVLLVALIVVGTAVLGSLQRPINTVSTFHTPSEKHIHQVYGPLTITQRIVAPTNSISGIRFFIDPESQTPPDAPFTLHVQPAGEPKDIRTVSTTFGESLEEVALEHHTGERDIFYDGPTLYIPFEPITSAHGKEYDITIEAPSLKKPEALRIRYEIDGTKYEAGQTFDEEGNEKNGDVSFVLYERPTLLTLVNRWLFDPEHRSIWVAFGLSILGLIGLLQLGTQKKTLAPYWQESWAYIRSYKRHITWSAAGVAVLIGIAYWPATNLFFFHDDVPILYRAKHFAETNPILLLSAHKYIDPDEKTIPHNFEFYRPLTASFCPWLLTLTGPNATFAFSFNLIMFSLAGVALYLCTILLLRSYMLALIPVSVWAFHSSKLGVVYWWSSVQDILAILFALITFILYTSVRVAPSRTKWALTLVSFFLALLSKEYVIVLPAILFLADTLFNNSKHFFSWTNFKQHLIFLSPLILVAGFFLMIRTVALHDPTKPWEPWYDNTYEMRISPQTFIQNVVVYSALTAERYAWPVEEPMENIEATLQKWLSHVQIDPPFYPGVVLIVLAVLLTIFLWKYRWQRNLLLFAGVWWTVFLAPNLFLIHLWSSRWLTLPVWSLGIALTLPLTVLPFSKPRVHTFAIATICLLLFFYGFMGARNPERTQFFVEQSAYTREALGQFKEQEHKLSPETTIYLVGIVPEQTTSLNAYLFRLYARGPFKQMSYSDTIPEDVDSEHDIVINMTGITAKYILY